jgi:isoleucyl-tRNA synthetase
LRSKFLLKLWNTYAFFSNYARLDGFDPAKPQVAARDRPDIDRWILSDLQKLIQTARREFERYSVAAFCLEAERFVDEKLSNWYIRRNRRRFWKSEQGEDKLAAYQTLYTVLTTLVKLFAPIIPFLTETMHQNLVGDGSVHWCSFPEVDETLLDADLSADMQALLRLKELGSAARNTVKIKVRQPLAEMRVQSADERDRRAVGRFADQLCEELNIKKVTLHEPSQGPLLRREVKPNMKTLGPKFGPRLKEVVAALAAADPAAVAEKAQGGEPIVLETPGGTVLLESADVIVQEKAPEGWAGAADRGTQVAIDSGITEELKLEGLAREVVRHVQELRKTAGLQMEDRIILSLQTESPVLRKAIEVHREYICRETLAVQLTMEPLAPGAHRGDVKVDGQALTIELRAV